MHARMAQSDGHPDAARDEKARRIAPYPKTPTARSGNTLDRPVSGLAHAALGGASCIAFPHLAAQWLLMQCRIAYRCGGSAGIARRSRVTGFPSTCRVADFRQAGLWLSTYRIGLQMKTTRGDLPEPSSPEVQPLALQEGDFYLEGGRTVFTADYHLRRGYCCGNQCRHCPYQEWKK
jgi:hypothetical protein